MIKLSVFFIAVQIFVTSVWAEGLACKEVFGGKNSSLGQIDVDQTFRFSSRKLRELLADLKDLGSKELEELRSISHESSSVFKRDLESDSQWVQHSLIFEKSRKKLFDGENSSFESKIKSMIHYHLDHKEHLLVPTVVEGPNKTFFNRQLLWMVVTSADGRDYYVVVKYKNEEKIKEQMEAIHHRRDMNQYAKVSITYFRELNENEQIVKRIYYDYMALFLGMKPFSQNLTVQEKNEERDVEVQIDKTTTLFQIRYVKRIRTEQIMEAFELVPATLHLKNEKSSRSDKVDNSSNYEFVAALKGSGYLKVIYERKTDESGRVIFRVFKADLVNKEQFDQFNKNTTSEELDH